MAEKYKKDFNRIAKELDIVDGMMSQEVYVSVMKDMLFFEQPDAQETGDTISYEMWQLVM